MVFISDLQYEDKNCDLRGRVDVSLMLCADVLTVGGFWPKSYAAGNRMCNSDWFTFLFSADIVKHFFFFYYSLMHESTIFVDW